MGLRGSTYLVDLDLGIPIHFAEGACCNYVAAEGNRLFVADFGAGRITMYSFPVVLLVLMPVLARISDRLARPR